jgi:hypothetical protein
MFEDDGEEIFVLICPRAGLSFSNLCLLWDDSLVYHIIGARAYDSAMLQIMEEGIENA